jgi:pyruvate dehydrogenase phosphatase
LTAEPEVTETRVREGDFLILASDGFWDYFSSEDAVTCVGEWVKVTGEKMVKVQEGPGPGFRKSTTYVRDEGKGYVDWKATSEHFVVEDANIATHLVRNALGGSRRELFCGIMSAQPPLSRIARDNITVTVVFF